MGGVSAIGGRMGAVGTCEGIRVDLRVRDGFQMRQVGGWDARR